jgi:hypothetical protein
LGNSKNFRFWNFPCFGRLHETLFFAEKQEEKMKRFAAIAVMALAALVFGCKSGPKALVEIMDDKGNDAGGIPTPEWVVNYVASGITAVQNLPQYKDRYCIIGDEFGANRQFVTAWADNFSAQQRIGAMLRTTIASEYQARSQGAAQSSGTGAGGSSSGEYSQQLNSAINAIVNVSYSGAQREADWWMLLRRYDPDDRKKYTDEYRVYVLYTIPKAEMNRQVARALETSVSKDSALYDITIAIAREILAGDIDFPAREEALEIAAASAAPAAPAPAPVSPPAPAAPAAPAAAPGRTYKIGDTGPGGGIVFFDKFNNQGGWQYLEAAPADIELRLFAGSPSTDYSDCRNRAVGSGKPNSQTIAGRGGSGLAAQACEALALNGCDDWFLPSRDELNYMFQNLNQKGLGNFRTEWYWSSTSYEYNSGSFYAQNFTNGSVDTSGGSSNQYRIRACRQF